MSVFVYEFMYYPLVIIYSLFIYCNHAAKLSQVVIQTKQGEKKKYQEPLSDHLKAEVFTEITCHTITD